MHLNQNHKTVLYSISICFISGFAHLEQLYVLNLVYKKQESSVIALQEA